MPKYSTGDSAGGGGSCELCGTSSDDLTTATVAGAELDLCPDCVPHGEQDRRSSRDSGSRDGDSSSRERNSRQRAARNTAKLADAQTGDSSRWEREGTNYDRDQLPYLVSGYGDRVQSAREDADLGIEELADELDADPGSLRSIEEGRAARAGVGGSLVEALEDRLGVMLIDD
jgi:ribosome-binding protein aMBF1 (putative translation factor)